MFYIMLIMSRNSLCVKKQLKLLEKTPELMKNTFKFYYNLANISLLKHWFLEVFFYV